MIREPIRQGTRASPSKFAHIVLRSTDSRAAGEWYKEVLNARIVFEADLGVGLTFDEEHHRVAIIQMSDDEVAAVKKIGDLFQRVDAQRKFPGLEHAAFTFSTLGDLLGTYSRLKLSQITPVFCVNHGGTLSMYYLDPDGNNVELQIDTMTMEQSEEFMHTPEFKDNSVGAPFDPEELCELYEQGRPLSELYRIGWN